MFLWEQCNYEAPIGQQTQDRADQWLWNLSWEDLPQFQNIYLALH